MVIIFSLSALSTLSAPCAADSLREAVIAQSIDQHNADVRSGNFQAAQSYVARSKVAVSPVPAASFSRGSTVNIAAAPTMNSSIGASPAGPVPQDPPKKISHPQKRH